MEAPFGTTRHRPPSEIAKSTKTSRIRIALGRHTHQQPIYEGQVLEEKIECFHKQRRVLL